MDAFTLMLCMIPLIFIDWKCVNSKRAKNLLTVLWFVSLVVFCFPSKWFNWTVWIFWGISWMALYFREQVINRIERDSCGC